MDDQSVERKNFRNLRSTSEQCCREQSRQDAEDMQWMLSMRRCTQYKPEAQASEYSPP